MRSGRISSLLVPVLALTAWIAVEAQTETPVFNVGRTPTAEEIQAWSLTVGPDGKDLPPGKGSAKEGAVIYAQKCAVCHGPNGRAGRSPALVGGLDTLKPPLLDVKVTTAAWPYAASIWSAIRSAMPPRAPRPLTADEAYAVTAALLYWNGIIKESDIMDAQSLPKVTMPRRDSYVPVLEDIDRLRCREGTCP